MDWNELLELKHKLVTAADVIGRLSREASVAGDAEGDEETDNGKVGRKTVTRSARGAGKKGVKKTKGKGKKKQTKSQQGGKLITRQDLVDLLMTAPTLKGGRKIGGTKYGTCRSLSCTVVMCGGNKLLYIHKKGLYYKV